MTTPRTHTTAPTKDTSGADAAPADFFVPGAHYVDGDGYKAPEQTHTFQCEHIVLHPRPGAGPRAFGFLRNNAPGSEWFSKALTKNDFDQWTRIPETLDAPTDGTDPAADAPF
ncbi:hypothetical protein [Streptomyces cinereoruber]